MQTSTTFNGEGAKKKKRKKKSRKKGVEFRKTYCIYLHVLCADVQQNCEHLSNSFEFKKTPLNTKVHMAQ